MTTTTEAAPEVSGGHKNLLKAVHPAPSADVGLEEGTLL